MHIVDRVLSLPGVSNQCQPLCRAGRLTPLNNTYRLLCWVLKTPLNNLNTEYKKINELCLYDQVLWSAKFEPCQKGWWTDDKNSTRTNFHRFKGLYVRYSFIGWLEHWALTWGSRFQPLLATNSFFSCGKLLFVASAITGGSDATIK